MDSEANRPPGTAPQQPGSSYPFGPPLRAAGWPAPPPMSPPVRDSQPAAAPPRIVRRPTEAPEAPEWAIDPDAIQRALRPATRPVRRAGNARRWLIALAVVLIAAVVGVGVTMAVGAERHEPGTPAALPAASTTTVATSAVTAATTAPAIGPQIPPCRAESHDGITVGNGAGGVTDGPNAILGFEYSYYTERSGERAQAFVAPDTVNVAAAEGLQQAIDSVIPVGTTYCVRIVAREPDLFDVDIDEYRPDGHQTTYHQSVRTVVRDGRTLLYEIRGR